jgi:hypothetical protein
MNTKQRAAISVLLLMTAAATATADNTQKAVEDCKAAIIESEGNSYSSTSLKKIKSRGRNYEVWINVSDGDRDLKSYCKTERGGIDVLVTTEGEWTGSNPRRPEA